jgi:hypothetical protein
MASLIRPLALESYADFCANLLLGDGLQASSTNIASLAITRDTWGDPLNDIVAKAKGAVSRRTRRTPYRNDRGFHSSRDMHKAGVRSHSNDCPCDNPNGFAKRCAPYEICHPSPRLQHRFIRYRLISLSSQ